MLPERCRFHIFKSFLFKVHVLYSYLLLLQISNRTVKQFGYRLENMILVELLVINFPCNLSLKSLPYNSRTNYSLNFFITILFIVINFHKIILFKYVAHHLRLSQTS